VVKKETERLLPYIHSSTKSVPMPLDRVIHTAAQSDQTKETLHDR
jgi:hypothetical protein